MALRAALRHGAALRRSAAIRSYFAAASKAQSEGKQTRASLAAWLFDDSPLAAESVATLGFDSIVLDGQHGLVTSGSSLVSLCHAIAAAPVPAGASPPRIICRLPRLDDAEIAKALDAGAAGLICPMVNSSEQAEALVHAAHFPPEGRRSFGPHRTAWVHGVTPGEWVRAQNDAVRTYAMVETRGALDALESILSVERLTGVFIGPNDLGLALGHEPTSAPTGEVLEAVTHIRERAHAAGKEAGIFCADAEACRRMVDVGFDLVSVGADLGWLRAGAAAALARVRE